MAGRAAFLADGRYVATDTRLREAPAAAVVSWVATRAWASALAAASQVSEPRASPTRPVPRLCAHVVVVGTAVAGTAPPAVAGTATAHAACDAEGSFPRLRSPRLP